MDWKITANNNMQAIQQIPCVFCLYAQKREVPELWDENSKVKLTHISLKTDLTSALSSNLGLPTIHIPKEPMLYTVIFQKESS